MVPEHVTVGVSGDAFAATGLNAGCDAWYSVIGGALPKPALTITRAAQEGCEGEAAAESERLESLWGLFAEFGGSLRVTAAIAEHLGLAPHGRPGGRHLANQRHQGIENPGTSNELCPGILCCAREGT